MIYACYDAIPTDDELVRGTLNDDGAGIAWIGLEEGKRVVRWQKGLPSDVDAVKEVIKKENITLPFAIHFRTASVGGAKTTLTHPFPVYDGVPLWLAGYAETLMMHNGHFNNWEELVMKAALGSGSKIPGGAWSDSRALAYVINLLGEGVIPFIVGQNRIMIMDALREEDAKEIQPRRYFRLYGNWVQEKGWSQSISTNTGMGRYRMTPGWERADDDDDSKSIPILRLAKEGAKKEGNSTSTVITPKTTVFDAKNYWTVEELWGHLKTMEEEQRNAETTTGL